MKPLGFIYNNILCLFDILCFAWWFSATTMNFQRTLLIWFATFSKPGIEHKWSGEHNQYMFHMWLKVFKNKTKLALTCWMSGSPMLHPISHIWLERAFWACPRHRSFPKNKWKGKGHELAYKNILGQLWLTLIVKRLLKPRRPFKYLNSEFSCLIKPTKLTHPHLSRGIH